MLEASSLDRREVLTDATGHFLLEGLSLRHAYTLIATHAGLGARVPLSFRGPEGARASFLAERVGISLELKPAAEVSGRVLDDARRPLVGARVSLDEKTGDTTSTVARTRTDAEGHYSLGPVTPGPLRLAVEAEGWHFPEHDTWTDFPAGTSTRDVLMSPDAPIEGVLVDGSGQPVAHARMKVSSRRHRLRATCESGPDGHFLLNVPLPGDYELSIDDERIREASWEPVVVAPSHLRLSVALRPRVVGEVVDETGAPVPEASVSLWEGPPTQDTTSFSRVGTDAQGRFSLPSPASGHYLLAAELQQEGLLHSTSQGVDVGEVETHVRMRFAPTHALSGVVVDARGQPLEGAHVSLQSSMHTALGYSSNTPDWGVRTGADGRFSFEAVSGEALELSAFLSARVLRQPVNDAPRDALRVEPGARDVRVVLIRDAEVHGRLVRTDGSPVSEFLLNGRVQDGEAGRFSFPILGTGTLQLEFAKLDQPDAVWMRRSVHIQEEEDQDLGTLVLEEP